MQIIKSVSFSCTALFWEMGIMIRFICVPLATIFLLGMQDSPNDFLFTMHISRGQPLGWLSIPGTKHTQLGCLSFYFFGSHPGGSHNSQEPKQMLSKLKQYSGRSGVINTASSYCF
jgi:hypothetical protein